MSALGNIVRFLSEWRNPYGRGHGRPQYPPGLKPRHARLAIDAAECMSASVVQTRHRLFRDGSWLRSVPTSEYSGNPPPWVQGRRDRPRVWCQSLRVRFPATAHYAWASSLERRFRPCALPGTRCGTGCFTCLAAFRSLDPCGKATVDEERPAAVRCVYTAPEDGHDS